jgi:aspartate aminotransferase
MSESKTATPAKSASVSARGRLVPASPIRKLAPFAEEAKARGLRVYHLNIGQPDIETPAVMREALQRIGEKTYEYTPSAGTKAYVDSIRKYYDGLGIRLGAGEVLGTTGGSEALQFAFLACADQGDEILITEPFYTNYRAFAAIAGVEMVPLLSRVEDGFHMPAREEWEKALTSRTKAVVITNPNNPTGTIYTREELEMIAGFCKDHGLFLISDEVYREFVYDGAQAVSALTLKGMEELVVVVDSLSKRFSACGIRLGAMVTRNKDVFEAALHMAQGRLSPPGLAQAIAPAASTLGSEFYGPVVAEYQKRRDILYEGLTKIPGIFLRKPEGAFYFIARLPVEDAEDFARWLLTDFSLEGGTVMVAPAAGFYVTEGRGLNEVRIAYVLKGDDLRQAVKILAAALPVYRKARGI